jgi:hypothetical protein
MDALSIRSARRTGTNLIHTGLCVLCLVFPAGEDEARADPKFDAAQLELAALPQGEGLPRPAAGCGRTTIEATCRSTRPQDAANQDAANDEDVAPYDCACVTKSVTEKLAGYTSPPPAG